MIECLGIISEKCIECKLCRKECELLQKYGNPKSIADSFDRSNNAHHATAFECSLCGLCSAVCPVGLDPARMFLEMRRDAVRHGGGDYPGHSVILGYERRGTSRRYTYYGLPEGCETVFFPGCALSGTRPDKVMGLYAHMKKSTPTLGIVLDCCTKPSHDLGREDHFRSMFAEMKGWLLEKGVRNVLVACTNCHAVFREHGGELMARTVYELLSENGLPDTKNISGIVTLHDPCAVRFEKSVHAAVRKLIERKGLTVEEMEHCKEKTLCCGEGGSVRFISPELAKRWCLLRKEEARNRMMLTYCAGCAGLLGTVTPTSHILDLLFEPKAALSGKVKISRSPFTYWNRIRLKGRFKKMLVDTAATRERTFTRP